jgi:hypothetical protein
LEPSVKTLATDPRIGTLIEQLIVPALLERLLAERRVSIDVSASAQPTRVESQPSV